VSDLFSSVGSSSLPPVDQAQLPADVQKAGPQARRLYATALGFEQMLVEQLTQQLDTSNPNGDGSSDDSTSGDGSGDGSDATSGMYTQMLPGAFAQSISGAGGIGLADELYRSMSQSLPGAGSSTTTSSTEASA
jgi:Rod binding domain-containing protein